MTCWMEEEREFNESTSSSNGTPSLRFVGNRMPVRSEITGVSVSRRSASSFHRALCATLLVHVNERGATEVIADRCKELPCGIPRPGHRTIGAKDRSCQEATASVHIFRFTRFGSVDTRSSLAGICSLWLVRAAAPPVNEGIGVDHHVGAL